MTCIKNTTRGCCFSANAQGEPTAQNCPGCHKLEVFDWMADLPDPLAANQIYEIQFKNTRKGFYINNNELELKTGDIVAVEASPGHDIGIVTLAGDLVTKQMKKSGFNPVGCEFKKIYRKAKPYDIEKWQEAIALEHSTMIRSRQISANLGLNMKIGDVEYQGDRLKAIFYYIADERVDFRELIKILADQFKIRVEMRQIGARQEAGRIGGIAACGRELCCSTWLNNFSSVTIGAARQQEISLNPQKLAGQCGKLKCCLNYELDTYIDARRSFPRLNAPLEAMDGTYHLVKSDIFRRMMWFSPDPQSTAIMIPLSVDRVRKIVEMNRRGEKIDQLADQSLVQPTVEEPRFLNVVGEESITRFDNSARGNNNRRNRKRGGGGNKGENNSQNPQQNNAPRNNENNGNRRGDNNNTNRDNNRRNNNARPERQENGSSENRPTARPETGEAGRPQGDNNRGRNNQRRNGNRGGRNNGNNRNENRGENRPNNSNNESNRGGES